MAPVLDPVNFYHNGIVVADFDAALREYGVESGLTFQEPTTSVQLVRFADSEVREVEFRLAYSAEGPVHVELVQQISNTLLASDRTAALHHLGYWSEDVQADGKRLERGGMQLVMTQEPASGGPPMFQYYRSALGFYVELVAAAMRPAMEASWAALLGATAKYSSERSTQ